MVLGRFAEAQPELADDAAAGVRCYFRDLDGLSAPQAVEAVEAVRQECGAAEQRFWKPWFPVIDFNRCTNCMQCLSFCLFDVYGVSGDGKDQGPESAQLQDRLPGLLARLPGSGDPVSQIQSRPDQWRRDQSGRSARGKR